VDGPQSQPRKKSEYVHGHDFAVGMNVTLLGNFSFYIYDADDFTRRYFREELGADLAPKINVELPERAVPRAPTPPYGGYGSWDDSMASVTHLIPKAPKKDLNKLYHHNGKILRYKAKFTNPKPEDVDRIFVISLNLADDTLSIHEPPQRNLGIVTGRFLEKGVHMNQLSGRLIEPRDLVPGSVVSIYNHEFEILDMDEYTAKMYEDPNTRKCEWDLEAVLQKLREGMRQQYPLVRDIFRRFDHDRDGVMTVAEFQRALEKFGFMLSREEVLQIMRHFDSREDGQVSYNEFCDALLDEDFTTGMLKSKSRLDAYHDGSYAERAAVRTAERQETLEVRNAVRAIGECLYKRQNVFARLCKEFGHITHEATVTSQQIQHAFRQIGQWFELEDVQRCVLFLNPGADLERIPYLEFLKAVQTSFHDVAVHR